MLSLTLSLKTMALPLLVIINCILGFFILVMPIKESYTYIDGDYPLEAPIDNLERVAMTQFEGTHYLLNSSDRISNTEWSSIYAGTYTMRLGNDWRVFLIAMYHETHCLRAMEYTFIHPNSTVYTPEHIQHCINYLRQHFLCVADDQLETGDFLTWDMSVGSVHSENKVCSDWQWVRSAAADNLSLFLKTHTI